MPPKRVLIVDDEESVRRLLRRLIERDGHSVREASSAEAALARLEESAADVAFCDVQLGGNDGLWLARELRSRHPATAVVLATAIATIPPVLSMQAGVVAYLVKPFERQHVTQALALAETWTPPVEDERTQRDVLETWLRALERSSQ